MMAVAVRFPVIWIDLQHKFLYWHCDAERYVRHVDHAFYGVADNRAYAAAIAENRLRSRNSLTAREMTLELDTLRRLGLNANIMHLLTEIAVDGTENFDLRVLAVRTMDTHSWSRGHLREQVVEHAISLVEEETSSPEQLVAMIDLLRELRSIDHSPNSRILRVAVRIAIHSDQAAVRDAARGAITKLKSRAAARPETIDAISNALLARLDDPLTTSEQINILDVLVALEVTQATPRIGAHFLQDFDCSEEQDVAMIDAMTELLSLKFRENGAGTALEDLQPLINASQVNEYAEAKLAECIEELIAEYDVDDPIQRFSLLQILAQCRHEYGVTLRLISRIVHQGDEAAIRQLIAISLISKNDQIHQRTIQAAIELMQRQVVDEPKTLASLLEWLNGADTDQQCKIQLRLARLPIRDRSFFLARLRSTEMRKRISALLAGPSATPTDDTAAQDMAMSDALQQALDDGREDVRNYALAILCARRSIERVVPFLEQWIARQEMALKQFRALQAETPPPETFSGVLSVTIELMEKDLDCLKRHGERARRFIAQPDGFAYAQESIHGWCGLHQILDRVLVRWRQLERIPASDRKALETKGVVPAPMSLTTANEISGTFEHWCALESLLPLYVPAESATAPTDEDEYAGAVP